MIRAKKALRLLCFISEDAIIALLRIHKISVFIYRTYY